MSPVRGRETGCLTIFNHLKIKKMARQKSIIALEGTLGNITFFKSRDGYMAREKGGVNPDKIANDPAFERTRENNAEFGRAVRLPNFYEQLFAL
jgi:hypothetical protein